MKKQSKVVHLYQNNCFRYELLKVHDYKSIHGEEELQREQAVNNVRI